MCVCVCVCVCVCLCGCEYQTFLKLLFNMDISFAIKVTKRELKESVIAYIRICNTDIPTGLPWYHSLENSRTVKEVFSGPKALTWSSKFHQELCLRGRCTTSKVSLNGVDKN